MILKRLQLINIATYDNVTLDFDKLAYPVFVTGENGAGKTTLFVDAITAALFGVAYGQPKLFKEFLMKGKSSGKIILEFELQVGNEKKVYRVERILRRVGSNEVRITEVGNPRFVLVGEQAKNFISEVLGLNHEALANSTIIRQGEVEKFLNMRASERRAALQEILRVDMSKYKKVVSKKIKDLENKKNYVEGEIKILEREIKEKETLERALREAYEQKPKVKREIEELQKEKDQLSEILDSINRQIGTMEEKKKYMETRKKELENKKAQLARIIAEIREIQKLKEEIKGSIINNVAKYNAIILELKEKETKLMELRQRLKEIEQYEQKLRRLERLSASIEKLKDMKSQISELEELLRKAESEKSAKIAEIDQIKKAINELNKAENVCPICGAPLPEEKKKSRIDHLNLKIAKIEKILEGIKQQIVSYRETLNKLRNQYDILQRDLGEYRALEAELRRYSIDLNEKDKLIQDILNIEKEIRQIKEQLKEEFGTEDLRIIREILRKASELNAKLEKLNLLLARKTELEQDIDAIKRELDMYNKELEEYTKLENQKKMLERRLVLIERKLKEKNNALGELEERIKLLKERIESLKLKEKELADRKERLRELDLDLRAYKLLERAFSEGGLPAILLQDYLGVISNIANKYLRNFGLNIEINLTLGRKKQKGEVTYTVGIEAYADGRLRDIKTFSGGEKTLMGFAIRLAIGELVAALFGSSFQPKFLIIDEGFGSLDAEKRQLVAEAIAALSAMGKRYSQIIVISHQQDLKYSHVFQSIIRVSKVGGRSKFEIENVESQTVYPSS